MCFCGSGSAVPEKSFKEVVSQQLIVVACFRHSIWLTYQNGSAVNSFTDVVRTVRRLDDWTQTVCSSQLYTTLKEYTSMSYVYFNAANK